jgi:hypothetical protein
LASAFTCALLTACNNQDPEEQIPHLQGYWEIEKVEFSKDSIKAYTFNETVIFWTWKMVRVLEKK